MDQDTFIGAVTLMCVGLGSLAVTASAIFDRNESPIIAGLGAVVTVLMYGALAWVVWPYLSGGHALR